MSDITAYDLIKQQKEKCDVINKKAKEVQKSALSEVDKKEILRLKNQWNELILETEKLKKDYDKLIYEMKTMRKTDLEISRGKTWRHKLARWLVK